MIRERIGGEFLTVTPGIRLKDDAVGDQKRVATPDFARAAGVSYMVVGRSITRSKIRLKVIKSLLKHGKVFQIEERNRRKFIRN